jgi:hypothetical protein
MPTTTLGREALGGSMIGFVLPTNQGLSKD